MVTAEPPNDGRQSDHTGRLTLCQTPNPAPTIDELTTNRPPLGGPLRRIVDNSSASGIFASFLHTVYSHAVHGQKPKKA